MHVVPSRKTGCWIDRLTDERSLKRFCTRVVQAYRIDEVRGSPASMVYVRSRFADPEGSTYFPRIADVVMRSTTDPGLVESSLDNLDCWRDLVDIRFRRASGPDATCRMIETLQLQRLLIEFGFSNEAFQFRGLAAATA